MLLDRRNAICVLVSALAVTAAALAASGGAYRVGYVAVPGASEDTEIEEIVDVNGLAMFEACGEEDDEEFCALFRSDGTDAGTAPVLGLGRGPAAQAVTTEPVAVMGGTLFFPFLNQHDLDESGDDTLELWRSDGVTSNLVWPLGGFPELRAIDGKLFFRGCDANGCELWKSDGTTAGTAMVADLFPGPASSDPGSLIDFHGTLVFSATDAAAGRELWRSDGTPAGTALIADIDPGPGSSAPADLINAGGTLFFTAQDQAGGRELWKSDGSSEGTARVADIVPGPESSSPFGLTAVGDAVLFGLGAEPGGLWRSDGTAAGTLPLADVQLEALPRPPPRPGAVVGRTFFFSGCEPAHGCELWRSDGTPEGTAMVVDLEPGPASSSPRDLTAGGCSVFFDVRGRGVWRSNGSAAGTVQIQADGPDDAATDQVRMGVVGDTLYFALSKDFGAGELWAVPLAETAADCAADGFLCYDVHPRQLPIRGLKLADRFVKGSFNVRNAQQLCTPAGYDGRLSSDEATYLEAYRVLPQGAKGSTGPLTLTNTLGQVTLVGRGPWRLLVPTAQDSTSAPAPPDPDHHGSDHYACYRARVAPGTTYPRARVVTLGDQFTRPAARFIVGAPRQFCAPVDKRGEGIEDPARYLVCYRVRPAADAAPTHRDVFVTNQFGTERLGIGRAEDLCVPSVEVSAATGH